jgi:hypothetical protein
MEGDGMKIIESKQAEYKEYVAKNSGDGYSKGVVDYAERWADLMEKALETWRGGNELSPASVMRFLVDNADKLSHEADTDGITGFMYGCAVSAEMNPRLRTMRVNGELLPDGVLTRMKRILEGEKNETAKSVVRPDRGDLGFRYRLNRAAQALARKAVELCGHP